MAVSLRAGCAQVPITPPVGTELAGYGPYLARVATGVQQELQATALALADGDDRYLVVSLDLIGVGAALAQRIREAVAFRCGVPGDRVLLACTHTHSGPATLFLRGWGEPAPDYLALLPRHIAKAADRALAALQPARLSHGAARVPGLAVNRAEHDGPVGDQVDVIQVAGEQGLLALLVSFACHAVVQPALEPAISPDWVGAVGAAVAARYGCPLVYLQGACGDLNPSLLHTGRLVETAALLLDGLDQARPGAEPFEARLAMVQRPCCLPLDPPDRDDLLALQEAVAERLEQADLEPAARRRARFELEGIRADLDRLAQDAPRELVTELQALRLGDDLVLAACGAELFTRVGQAVRDASPFASTLVVGYANDLVGYLPDPAEFERRGYAAEVVPRITDHYPFRPDAAAVLVAGLGGLLHALRS